MASVLAAQSAIVSLPASLPGAVISESSVVRAFGGFKPARAAPLSAGSKEWAAKTVSKGSRVNCITVVDPVVNDETLSYLPPLDPDSIFKEVDYLLKDGWIPCLEFDNKVTVNREFSTSPSYYDGRWSTWKMPMSGCQSASQVMIEIDECKKTYPQANIRILGFDNKSQVQCTGFLVQKQT